MSESPPILALENVSKAFGVVQALLLRIPVDAGVAATFFR
ncbi:MAG: hypothetical protein JWR24_1780 [Actinoallomurus sp.]|jgi:hypothetical protein|nr:hypothetical protein [Actinoallomurus sp.]